MTWTPKHLAAADRKALQVATFLNAHSRATLTLQHIADHFGKSTTWAHTYRTRALSGQTKWRWLPVSKWQPGDLVHTNKHTLLVRETKRSDHQVWAYVIIRNRVKTLQIFDDRSTRLWPVTTKKEMPRKP